MKAPILISAVTLAGLTVIACSKPNDQSAPQAPNRNLELIGAATPDSAVVSPVEVGRGMSVPLLTRRSALETRRSPLGARRSAPTPAAGGAAEFDLSPKVQVTTIASALAPALSEIPAPPPAGPLAVAAATGEGNGHAEGGRSGNGPGGEPTILIRGGIGTPRDDCKIHGVGRAGGGILINRRVPPLGGGRAPATSFSGPVRIR